MNASQQDEIKMASPGVDTNSSEGC